MKILISTSKTMNYSPSDEIEELSRTNPVYLDTANKINFQLSKLSRIELQKIMKTSPKLTSQAIASINLYNLDTTDVYPAIRYFSGDIYKGIKKLSWTADDCDYAQDNLRIISGLYGILKPLDQIKRYRLEMGYRLKNKEFKYLDKFWKDKIAIQLKDEKLIFNLLPIEYSKAVLPLPNNPTIISPQFLVENELGLLKNIIINTKLTRGLMASWLITNRIKTDQQIRLFNLDGYSYSQAITKDPTKPVFIKSITKR